MNVAGVDQSISETYRVLILESQAVSQNLALRSQIEQLLQIYLRDNWQVSDQLIHRELLPIPDSLQSLRAIVLVQPTYLGRGD